MVAGGSSGAFCSGYGRLAEFGRCLPSISGRGKAAFDSRLLISLLFYGYATGVFSSRKLEAATYDSPGRRPVAFRFIAGNLHPDHDTIAAFRKRFLPQIKGWFKDILLLGKVMKLVRLGNIYFDGTKIQVSASRHKAMSYEYMKRLEEQLEAEIDKLLELAAAQDEQEKELQPAKEVVEARAEARYQEEKQEYEQKLERRRKQKEETGKKPRGKAPKAPRSAPKESDQYNFTDPESRIIKTSRGFEQCYNGQAAVNEDMVILGGYSIADGNDKKEFVAAVGSVPQELGSIKAAVADSGYFSGQNVKTVQEVGIEPIIAIAREPHNNFLKTVLNQSRSQPKRLPER